MYKPNVSELVASEQTIDIQKILKKQWEDYDKVPEADLDVDPAQWWSGQLKRGLVVSYIAILARACLGVPGSSADLERAFSHAGATITPKRARLKVKRACDIIFLHENILKGNV